MEEKEPKIAKKFRRKADGIRIPIYLGSGLLIVAGLIVVFFLILEKRKRKEKISSEVAQVEQDAS